jgi:hypothetical protein
MANADNNANKPNLDTYPYSRIAHIVDETGIA